MWGKGVGLPWDEANMQVYVCSFRFLIFFCHAFGKWALILTCKGPLTYNAIKLFNESAVKSAGDGTVDLKKRVEELAKNLVDYEKELEVNVGLVYDCTVLMFDNITS